jgi:hypothetical protein
MLLNINVQIILVYVPLKIIITHLIEVFEFSKIFIFLLYGIICQMYKFILKILEIKFPTTGPDIAIFVKIALKLPIDTCHKPKTAEIKFPFIYQ